MDKLEPFPPPYTPFSKRKCGLGTMFNKDRLAVDGLGKVHAAYSVKCGLEWSLNELPPR